MDISIDTAALSKLTVGNPWCYVGYVLLAGLTVRLALSVLRTLKYANEDEWRNVICLFVRTVLGFHPKPRDASANYKDVRSDHLSAFVLGLLELGVYPLLIAANLWPAVGAWITLKMIAQWSVWQEDRGVFNLFLIGTIVNVLVGALLLTQFVTVPTP